MVILQPLGTTAMRDNAVRWLRRSYWTGAGLDLLAALNMLFPGVFAAIDARPGFHPGADYRYAMGMGAPLMLGWTVLLLWADRKPIERKGVLPITLVPVVLGLVANEIAAVAGGFMPLAATVPIWVLQALLTALFAFSYWNASRA